MLPAAATLVPSQTPWSRFLWAWQLVSRCLPHFLRQTLVWKDLQLVVSEGDQTPEAIALTSGSRHSLDRLLKQAGGARTDRADCTRGAAARVFSWQRPLCRLFACDRHWSVIQRSCAVTDGHQHRGPTLSRGRSGEHAGR